MATLIAAYSSEGLAGRCDAKCYCAEHPQCSCICGGVNHGAGLEKAMQNTRDMAKTIIENHRERGLAGAALQLPLPLREAPPHCARCGSTEDLEEHHVVARADGGGNEAGNIEILCRPCHHGLHLERGDYARWKEEGIQALYEDFGEKEARAMLSKWGRRGALATAERHAEKLPEWGQRGGRALVEKYGRDHMAEIGRKGRQAQLSMEAE